ncbi:MAG: membrane protein insertase YidC [Saprospiraceae bacterium]|nr:membrane protein insertase YidC [Saprospiraceae bacterium]
MDRNSIIGLALIFLLLYLWSYLNTPSKEQLAAQQRTQDSLVLVTKIQDSLKNIATATTLAATVLASPADSLAQKSITPDTTQNEEVVTLENDVFVVTLTNKGGRIKEVLMKKYFKNHQNGVESNHNFPLKLLEDEKNKFGYLLPFSSGNVSTENLYFKVSKTDNQVTFSSVAPDGKMFEQRYAIKPNSYDIGYEIAWTGFKNDAKVINLTWNNYLDKIEKNDGYERNFSSVYYNNVEEQEVDYCSCTGADKDEISQKVKWVSHAQQFFNSSLIAKESFNGVVAETEVMDATAPDLKLLKTNVSIPVAGASGKFDMNWYVGPNEFDRLATYHNDLEDVIAFGSSILGTINRWVIRPTFNFLQGLVGVKGIAILVLTLLVKLILYPLTYRMIHSQSKMAALKPELDKLKAKYGDDQQKAQMESMSLYREFGVNPLGGCLPMVLQMPIWLALYRFFPASIDFRQVPFLWATDLSSYDVFMQLPFTIPFYGSHVSLFSLLWVITTLIYTYYSTKDMDFSMNPAMKYMQYLMPLFFIFFFNNVAAGLSCYLLFSNILNIGQTIITRNYIIDKDKIKADMEAYRKQPKKKGGFTERLDTMMKEQQRIQQEREKVRKK